MKSPSPTAELGGADAMETSCFVLCDSATVSPVTGTPVTPGNPVSSLGVQVDALTQPYQIGAKVPCLPLRMKFEATESSRSAHRMAEILNFRPLALAAGEYEYYVHYVDYDKRMDEWVTADRLDVARLKRNAQKKRKNQQGSGAGGHAPGTPTVAPCAAPVPPAQPAYEEEEVDPHDDHSKPKNIGLVHFGRNVMEAWYFSPYSFTLDRFQNVVQDYFDADFLTRGPPPVPEEYSIYPFGEAVPKPVDLWVCQFCLKPCVTREQLEQRHVPKCRLRHPPGDEIYRDPSRNLSVFEVDGKRQRVYCQHLCLLSKLFLEHKFLRYNVEPFLFYIMTEWDETGHHMLGYFSKEKESPDGYNLACILTLPLHQQRGVGRLLIELSYELSKKEQKIGSPERPLSDLGQVSYFSYWRDTLLELLLEFEKRRENISIVELARVTCITPQDIVTTLTRLAVLHQSKKCHCITIPDWLKTAHQARMARRQVHIDRALLRWTPPQAPK
eukprot:TRINITY_DN19374_c0_g1_i1.p1 TRINITY_DN19374_c0_g1~~TRINITY_DN19374_c0_g1_i1.p1  ORF type:complete len:506 (+),score=84.19 TRINITY_DN19374_c0_g1_i1:26-1519(+)